MPGLRASEAARYEQILNAAFSVAVRDRLAGLTIRAVAGEAGLSAGLVHFHFTNRDTLLIALLDWLLRGTIIGEVDDGIRSQPTAALRLMAFVRRELVLLPERRSRLELFFDFWVAGMTHKKIRGRIRAALRKYRKAVLPLTVAAVAESPEHFADVSGADLASLVISIIEGCVMQAIVDLRGFDVDRVFASVRMLLPAPVGVPLPTRRRRMGARTSRRPVVRGGRVG